MEAKAEVAVATHPSIARLLAKGTKPRVCIVGGGWNGLYALKWFIEEGLDDVVLFEMTDSIGGVWVYKKDQPGTASPPPLHRMKRRLMMMRVVGDARADTHDHRFQADASRTRARRPPSRICTRAISRCRMTLGTFPTTARCSSSSRYKTMEGWPPSLRSRG